MHKYRGQDCYFLNLYIIMSIKQIKHDEMCCQKLVFFFPKSSVLISFCQATSMDHRVGYPVACLRDNPQGKQIHTAP